MAVSPPLNQSVGLVSPGKLDNQPMADESNPVPGPGFLISFQIVLAGGDFMLRSAATHSIVTRIAALWIGQVVDDS
jgi:hypothetical protein